MFFIHFYSRLLFCINPFIHRCPDAALYNILKYRKLLPEPEEYDAEERDNMLRELATLMLMVA
jgi:hypothetical protein